MKGRLSQVEKYAVQQLVHDKKSPSEIAELLSRTEKCINNYINGELERIHSTIVKIEIEKSPPPPEPPKNIIKLPKGQAKRTMIRKTMGDKDGVSIMTSAASAVGDDFNKAMPKIISRTARGHLYDNEGNQIK